MHFKLAGRSKKCMLSVAFACALLLKIGDGTLLTTTETASSGSMLLNATGSTKQPNNPGNSSSFNHLRCARMLPVCHNYNRLTEPTIDLAAVKRKHGIQCSTATKKEQKKFCSLPIKISLEVMQITGVDEVTETISLSMTFSEFWKDTRVQAPPEYRDDCPDVQRVNNDSASYRPSRAKDMLWIPDVYITRIESVYEPEILMRAASFRMSNVGEVKFTTFGIFAISCMMNFDNFPMDIQYCPMYMESWRLEDTHQKVLWDPDEPIVLQEKYKLDQFTFSVRMLNATTMQYNTGNYSRAGVVFIFSRKLQFYVLQVYLPTVLFVIISWLTFLIPPAYAQGRIIMTITTMLTLAALFNMVEMHSPSSSYIKAIDIWMVVCYSFVFVAVVHCLVDIRLHFIDSQAYKHEALGFLAPVSVALVENRQVFDDLFGAPDDEPEAAPSDYFDAPSRAYLPEHRPILRTTQPTGRRRATVSFSVDSQTDDMAAAAAAAASSSSSTPLGRDQGDERDKRWGHVAVVFEKTSLIVYPAAFVLFNICYWAYYLNAARPPHLLAAEMAAGFTPRPSVGRLTTHGNH